MYNVGQLVVYCDPFGVERTGRIKEIFPSLDGSTLCYWVEGSVYIVRHRQIKGVCKDEEIS